MANVIKKRRSRTNDGHITILYDETERISFVKNGKNVRRKYLCILHRNNYVGRYWAGYGYFKKGRVKYLWMKSTELFGNLKEDMLHRYHNHIEIMLGQLKLVKAKASIIEEGGLPAMENGKGLPICEGYEIFKIVKKVGGDFDTIIEGLDGRQFQVSRDCFSRVKPENWIEDKYAK